MPPEIRNILSPLPSAQTAEVCETIAGSGSLRIERIVSNGQATPEGEWYNQEQDEWVLVLAGRAGLLFEGEKEPQRLAVGDCTLIPAGCRHRVAWTDPQIPTVWLAVHYTAEPLP